MLHEVGHYFGADEATSRGWGLDGDDEGGAGRPEIWGPVIGLEIHVQLSTKTKMFCGCALSFGDEPNVHTCPVCLGHPGTLPDDQRAGGPLRPDDRRGARVRGAPRAPIFHRKNYFYPDLPKGYQISQYDEPLAVNGRLGDVRIHRAHLEEDAAKMIHVGRLGPDPRLEVLARRLQPRRHAAGRDRHRAGPPIRRPGARVGAAAPRTTIRQLGVSDVNMEEGSLRVDANVSIRPADSDELGTKTELKNMNSFRFLERGIEAEIARQRELLERG